MTELKVKFTKGFVKRAAAVAMAVCLGATLIPADFVKAAETAGTEEQVKVGYAGIESVAFKEASKTIQVGGTAELELRIERQTLTQTEGKYTYKVTSGQEEVTKEWTDTDAVISGNMDVSGNIEITADKYEWKSDNENIAKVEGKGDKATVTAIKDGTATITATLGGKSCTATIIVNKKDDPTQPTDPTKPIDPTQPTDPTKPTDPTQPTTPTETVKQASKVAITLNGQTVKGTLKAKVGKTYSFKATVTPKDAKDKKVTWTTSNKKVATVDSKGKVKVKKAGKATITAKTSNGKTAKVTLNASKKAVKVTKVAITGSKSMKVKKSQTLKANITPATADNTKVTWKSSNKKIATVNSKGKVTAKKKGTVKITATAKDGSKKKATIKIKVK